MNKSILIFSIWLLCGFQFCYARITGGYYEYHSQKELIMKGEKDGVSVYLRDREWPQFLFVDNNGNEPIEFNYSVDRCYYITTDGKKYLLPFADTNEPYYEDGMAVLNPNAHTTMPLDSTKSEFDDFCNKLKEGKIKEILIEINYGKLKVKLLPVKK